MINIIKYLLFYYISRYRYNVNFLVFCNIFDIFIYLKLIGDNNGLEILIFDIIDI